MIVGSIALTGAVLVGGLITTYLWKAMMKDQMKHAAANDQSYFPTGRQTSKIFFDIFSSFFQSNFQFFNINADQLDDDDDNPMHQLMEKVERMFRKYDIDVTTCVQKMICTTVKNAAENVAKGNGSSAEKIFDGLSR